MKYSRQPIHQIMKHIPTPIADLLVVGSGLLAIILFAFIQEQVSLHFRLSSNSSFVSSILMISAIGLTVIAVQTLKNSLSKFQDEKRQAIRQKFINNYQFSEGLKKKFKKHHPELNEEQENLVFQALRDYFTCCLSAQKKMVSMPSQIVDEVWHEFILFTKEYHDFCEKAFGNFLHHTPAEAMSSPTQAQTGIKLAWQLACQKEGLNPEKPSKLPLIFEIDKKLKVPEGFYYELNCLEFKKNAVDKPIYMYCVTHIISTVGCGSSMTADTGNHQTNGDSCRHSHNSVESGDHSSVTVDSGCGSGNSCGSSCGGSCGSSCGSGCGGG